LYSSAGELIKKIKDIERYMEMGVRRRYIEAIKMRGSTYTTGKKLRDMTSWGLEVSP
jgi:hypothetical protein